jgi:hypothetical protein
MLDTRFDSFSALVNLLPSYTREGLLVHARLMPLSARTLLLPRQLAYYYPRKSGQKPLGFVSGVSGRNELSTVNFCQDIRGWRARLERHGIKVVKAASFSGRSQRDHLRFAEEIGYPVVLKPVIRNTLYEECSKDIASAEELAVKFKQSRLLRKNKASDLTASPYAMTRLSEDHVDEQGNRFLPLGVRYMVEKQLEGRQLRLIMARGQVAAAFHRSSGEKSWQTADSLHPSYVELGEKVAAVMQGMAFLRIDLIIQDQQVEAGKTNYGVIGISEHLKLYKLLRDHPVLVQRLLGLVADGGDPHARPESLQVRVVLSGISNEKLLCSELEKTADSLGVEAAIGELDDVTGCVSLQIAGPSWAAAGLTWVYANGLGLSEIPTSVDACPTLPRGFAMIPTLARIIRQRL